MTDGFISTTPTATARRVDLLGRERQGRQKVTIALGQLAGVDPRLRRSASARFHAEGQDPRRLHRVRRRLDRPVQIVRDAVQAGKLVAPDRLVTNLDPLAARRNEDRTRGRSLANDLFTLAGTSPEGWTVTECDRYGDWRSLDLAIKEAAKQAAREAGSVLSAATVDAQIRQARFDRFLSRVFAAGEEAEWLLTGGMSMLARVPRSRATKDVDLALQNRAAPRRATS